METNSQPAPGPPAPADGSGEVSTLGTLLKSARERRGLSLQQIVKETKIPLRHLEALERDRLSALPPGLYLRGEVRAYAKAVQLDPDVALRMLDRAPAAPVEQGQTQAPPSAGSPTRPSRRALFGGVGLLLVVATFTAVLWRRGPAPAPTQPPAGHPAETPAPTRAIAGSQVVTGGQAHPASEAGLESSTSATSGAVVPGDQSGAAAADRTAGTAIGDLDTQLTVVTQPPGARVTVNGIGWGYSPVTIRHLPPGEKRIRASLDGYVAVERVVDLAEGQPGKISVRLDRVQ